MGDAGEGLVDAESRFQERLAEREQEQRKRGGAAAPIDPEKKRKIDSLQLARTELQRQEAVTQNVTRKEQIRRALEDLERQLAKL
jgi:hypothetical protein